MDIFQALVFFITTIIFLFLAQFLTARARSKNSPPSPFSLPIIGHLHLIKKPIHHSLTDLATRYGPILSLRFGSRLVLVISSASLAEECFTKNDIIFANRPRLLAGKHLGYNYTTITWASYGQHWRNIRRISTLEIFSSARLNSFTRVRREEVKAMVEGLVRDCKEELGFTNVEMRSRLFELVLNVMMRMIAAKRYYGMDVKEVEVAKKFQEIVEETFKVSGATNLADFFPALWLGERKLVRLHKKRDAFMQALVDEHRRNSEVEDDHTEEADDGERERKKKSVIDVLLSLQQSDPEYYTDDIIKGAAGTLLIAGTDTSMVTVEWALSLLLNHPDTMAKAQAELDHNIGNHRLISESDLANLPFLHCIINETLRLHPPAPILPAHESSQDCNIGGFHVPSGTMLLVNAWAIQRDPKLWVDPANFRPERFTNIRAESEGLKWNLIPFGMGRRGCPGEGLAMRVVGLALGALIQSFEWGRKGEEVNLSEGAGLVVNKATPLEALCRPRVFLKKALESDSTDL